MKYLVVAALLVSCSSLTTDNGKIVGRYAGYFEGVVSTVWDTLDIQQINAASGDMYRIERRIKIERKEEDGRITQERKTEIMMAKFVREKSMLIPQSGEKVFVFDFHSNKVAFGNAEFVKLQ